MIIQESKYIEEVVKIIGDSYTEVSDEVKKYMDKGYRPVFVNRHDRKEGSWIGGATKRTRIKE